MKRALGDSHNFGRRVSLRGSRVAKPRPLLWEWLLLSGESPLRRFLDRAAREEGLPEESFAFLPTLAFSGERSAEGGEVERIALEPLGRSREVRRALAPIVGRAIALFSWLGVSDLHWENLVLGTDTRGHIVFAPLDVEMILADLSLPTETKLLPAADEEYGEVCRHAAGVRRVLPYLGKPVDATSLLDMATAYRGMLAFLDRRAPEIANVLDRLRGFRETPIRVCLRGTGDYVEPPEGLWPPLLEAELEQLNRGDIPYFFRIYGRPGIRYYGDESLRQVKTTPMRGDVPHLDPLLQLSRNLRSPSRRSLREEGLITLFGAFDHPSLTGRHSNAEMAVTVAARSISFRFANGEEVDARRDLSRFVGSVYLPCKCGEVRTVFVPAVTKCEAVA